MNLAFYDYQYISEAQPTDAIEYELCSVKPLLAVHTTSGGMTNPEPGTYVHDLDTEVTVGAIPDAGSEFTGWTGDVSGSINLVTVTLDFDKLVKANFLIHQYALTVIVGEGGTTVPEPSLYLYDLMTEVTVEAIAESGYRFSKWSGDATGTSNPIRIMMDSNKSVTANFVEASDESSDIFRFKCFIATAAYGSPSHPYVKVLQDFKDRYLMPYKFGHLFIDLC